MPERNVKVVHDYNRRSQRKSYEADAIFSFDSRPYAGQLKNVSADGAFIETKQIDKIPVGEKITISIPFTDGKKHVKKKGVIKWKNNDGFAIEFV